MSAPHHPAPWRTDAWLPADNRSGAYVWCVRDALGGTVLYDCGEDVARQVESARNTGDDAALAAAVEARHREVLEAARREVEEVRAHFRGEVEALRRDLERCRVS